jgi:hypothetical protein
MEWEEEEEKENEQFVCTCFEALLVLTTCTSTSYIGIPTFLKIHLS